MIRDLLGKFSIALLALLVLAAVLGPIFLSHEFDFQNMTQRLEGPSRSHWLGTDELGRDILVRLLQGARVSLGIGFATALLSLVLGTIIGGAAGYYGRWVDLFLMKISDIMAAVPVILLATLVMLVIGRNFLGMLVSISAFAWILQARLARGHVLMVKTQLYVEAARSIGAGNLRIFLRHILPQLRGPLLISLGVLIPANILLESFLSFLGLGLQPPLASWGSLAYDGFKAFESHPHLAIYPGATLFLTLLAMNYAADWLHGKLGVPS